MNKANHGKWETRVELSHFLSAQPLLNTLLWLENLLPYESRLSRRKQKLTYQAFLLVRDQTYDLVFA